MKIEIKKFGEVLTSRPDGKEAFLAIQPSLLSKNLNEEIILDFEGVDVLAPGWADEVVTKIMKEYPGQVLFENTDNPSVRTTINFLKDINNY